MAEDLSRAWETLVERYEEARRVTDAAFEAYNHLEPADSGDTPEELRYEAARDAEIAIEDELLAMKAPDLAAVAYQLKIFGLRYHSADFDDEPMSGEDQPSGPILRRIHQALLSAAS